MAPKKGPRIFWKKFTVIAALAVYLVAGLMVSWLYQLQKAYADRVFPGVKVAGYDFSGKRWEEAETQVEQLVETLGQTSLTISVEGGATFQPTLTELGVYFDKEKVLQSIFSIGHGASFREGFVKVLGSLAGQQTVDLKPIFDDNILQSYVTAVTGELTKEVKNAAFTVNQGTVEIVNSEMGRRADGQKLKDMLTSRLRRLETANDQPKLTAIFLDIDEVYPEIVETDLGSVKEQAQSMVGGDLTAEFEGKAYTFTRADIGSWLIFKEETANDKKTYRPVFDDTKISNSIAVKIAKFIDVRMNPRKTLITTGQVIDEGYDGRALDRAGFLKEIKRQLAQNVRQPIVLSASTIPKTEQQVYPDFTLGLYEGRYLEINISKQTLYAIEGSTLVASYLISSGKEWGGYATPSGTMYIKNKIGFAYSRQYALWMPYWNGLSWGQDGSGYEGYGIHELPCFNRSCTSREGINHLGRPVSHGCIRLGHNGPAAFIYEWAPVGTPVVVHR